MAEADSLRMVAEVVDRFSGPLRTLRSSLQAMSKDGVSHSEAVAKGLSRVEGAAKSAGQTASTVLNPALAAIGVTGLGVVAAMTGVGAALRNFGGNTAALGQLGRDASISADQLRIVQNVLGKVGIDANTSGNAIRQFAENMRLARDGIGPIMEFLRTQGKTTEGRAYFNQLADSLKNAKDNGEALTKALEGLEHIQDPAGRRKYAEEVLRLGDAAQIADGHLGSLREQFARARRELGPLDPATVKAAEDFEKAMSGLRTTMQKLGTAIATEAMPFVSEFVVGLKGLADGSRQDITGPLREGVRDVGKALREIDWKAASTAAGEFLKSAGDGAKELVGAIREVASILKALNEGKYLDALRQADGANGPLAQRLAPKADDDIIRKRQQIDQLQVQIESSQKGADTWLGKQSPSAQAAPEHFRRQLETAQRELEEMIKLRDAMNRLREGLNQRNGEATVQKQSFEEGKGEAFGGARIQTAAYGGGGQRSGSQPTGRGLDALGDPYVEDRFRAFLRNRGYTGNVPERLGGVGRSLNEMRRPDGPGNHVRRWQRGERPSGTEGSHNARLPDTPGQYRPQYQVSDADLDQRVVNKIAGEVSTRNPEGVDAVINNMMNRLGTKSWGPSANLREVALAKGQYAGNRHASAAETEFVRSRIRAIASGGVPDNTQGSNSYRSEPYYRQTIGRGRGFWAGRAVIGPNVGGNRYAYEPGVRNGPYAPYDPNAINKGTADGEGFARERARRASNAAAVVDFSAAVRERQAAADRRQQYLMGGPVMQRALKASAAGGPTLNANGSVEVHVARPGPDTKVSTSASGNLFRDVKLNRGRAMAAASQDN